MGSKSIRDVLMSDEIKLMIRQQGELLIIDVLNEIIHEMKRAKLDALPIESLQNILDKYTKSQSGNGK